MGDHVYVAPKRDAFDIGHFSASASLAVRVPPDDRAPVTITGDLGDGGQPQKRGTGITLAGRRFVGWMSAGREERPRDRERMLAWSQPQTYS